MIIGGTYETPITEGLLDADFVNQLKLQDTYNEDSFDREYKRSVLLKLLRIAGNPLELFELQRKYEIELCVKCIKIKKIGQSAAELRIEEGSTTKLCTMRTSV